MLIYIQYNSSIENDIFDLWISHYEKIGINYKILCSYNDLPKNYNDKIIYSIPENGIELTVHDFLFSFLFEKNKEMILILDIDHNFINQSLCIPRLFYIPSLQNNIYCHFEIPDFIYYKHINHTNYLHGLKINGGKIISSNIVCITLKQSLKSNMNEYYENYVFYMNNLDTKMILGKNIYITYNMNIFINKEKYYGIIWNQKAACTTITNIICLINNIHLSDDYIGGKRSINYHWNDYKYNDYLENINYIGFVRNPYHRFLSIFIDKHILKTDPIYLQLEGYQKYKMNNEDTIYNLCIFLLNGNYISEHYKPQSLLYPSRIKNCTWHKIENGLNEVLYNFLEKYHTIEKYKNEILLCNDNIISNKINQSEKILNEINILHLSNNEWIQYLEKYKLDYDLFLHHNIELKNLIYQLFWKDFIYFNYNR